MSGPLRDPQGRRRYLSCLLVGAACTAAGWAADVEWSLELGFNGVYKDGAWTPVSVGITNKGKSQSGRIVVPVTSATGGAKQIVKYVAPVEVPQNSQKLYRLCVPSERLSHASLYLDGQRRARDFTRIQQVAAEDTLVVVVTENVSLLNFLKGTPATAAQTPLQIEPYRGSPSHMTAQIQLTHALWGRLPDSWLGWDGVNAVVLASTRFVEASEKEIEALVQWVKLGGTLIVPGGAGSAAMAAGPFGDLLPLQVTGTRTVPDLQPLVAWVGLPLSRQAVLLADGGLRRDATVLCGTRQNPLIASRPVGAGRVIMTTFDFAAEPVKYWDGQTTVWRTLLAQSVSEASVLALAETSGGGYYRQGFTLGSAAAYTPAAELPPMWLMIGFLLAYLIVLVPVNYAVVSRLGRRELAWLTTPAIIAVFTFGAYGAGYALRGGQTILNRLGIIELSPGTGFARATGYVGLFSPAKMTYELLLEGTAAAARDAEAGAPSGGEQFTVVYGAQAKVTDLDVNMWSTRAVCVDFLADLGEGISGYFEYDGSDLYAKVKNNTGKKLSRCRILRQDRQGKAVTIEPREEAKLSFIQTSPIGPTGQPHAPPSEWRPEGKLEDRAMQALFGQQAAYARGYGPPGPYASTSPLRSPHLVAVCEEPLVPVKLAGKRPKVNDRSILIVRLPVKLAPSKMIAVPDWLVSSQVVQTQGRVSTGEVQDGLQLHIEEGHAIVEFVAPLGEAGGEALALELHAWHGGPSTRGMHISLSAYNFSSGAWVELRRTGRTVPFPRPNEFMDQQGRVRVKFSARGGGIGWQGVRLSAQVKAY